ncbi:uncharacterized protein LOC134283936 [Aedes albopictus]|uniref:Uncharacterized protein n=2 Tax=Aedes albopictus TaxID=7160 RepID=A0ABM2A564_AEDAL
MSTTSGKSGNRTERQATEAAVVTGIDSLTIVDKAKSGAKDAANQVTGAECAAALQPTKTVLNPKADDAVGAVAEDRTTGTKPKQVTNPRAAVPVDPQQLSTAPAGTTLSSIRVRVTRFSHCEMCNDRDNSRMVQCDNCSLWYHFSCVDVTSGIADYSWVCPACAEESRQLHGTSAHCEILHQDPSSNQLSSKRSLGKTSSKRSEQRRIDRRLQKLEELKELEKRFLEEKYRILDEEDDDVGTVTSDDSMATNEIVKIQGWLRETDQCGEGDSGLVEEDVRPNPAIGGNTGHETLHGFAPNQRSTPRSQINRQAPRSDSAAARGTNMQSHRMMDTFSISRSELRSGTRMQSYPTRTLGCPSAAKVHFQQPAQSEIRNQQHISSGSDRIQRRERYPSLIDEPEHDQHLDEDSLCVLNRSQLAARQVVPKDLPEFSGNAEDWPLFYSTYNSSTHMCGFSNEENMLRIRKCLKGKALEAVRCRLLHPTNVAGVMSTLKMLYGRPEAIVHASIRKIRSLPAPQVEKLDTLINFALTIENLVATIEACGVQDFVYNASLKFELIDRLPPGLKLDWAKHSRNNPAPNLTDFSSWLYAIAEDASTVMQTSSTSARSRWTKSDGFINVHADADCTNLRSLQADRPGSQSSSLVELPECIVCKNDCQSVAKCKRFTELTLDAKWDVVREAKLCRKCLRRHNGVCRQQKPCGTRGCTFLHHPLLHNERSHVSNGPSETPADAFGSCNIHMTQTNEILFRIVPVLIHGPSKVIRTYAFIDDGSELTLMEQSLADEIGVWGPKSSLCLKWTGGTNRVEDESRKVAVEISAVGFDSRRHQLTNVQTIHDLQLRPQTMVLSELQERFSYLSGLPVESYINVCPRILIGLDNAYLGHVLKSREGKPREPIAVKTQLGWIIYGSCNQKRRSSNYVNVHTIKVCDCNPQTDENLHLAMKTYFDLDSLGILTPNKTLRSPEEQRAVELLEKQTIPKAGRYEAGLLWKYENVRLPNSKDMAYKRWQCLDRRMNQDKQLSATIQQKMADYVSKGYVRKLTEPELNVRPAREWYLPVFPVMNPNKPNKVRLVWDAAACAYGISLNSLLLKGPDLLTSLLTVLIQFREFRIGICGDIREMYLQILLSKDTRLRFFWKENEHDTSPQVFEMLVLPFGVSCAPTIAQYVKNINAKQFEHELPTAVRAIVDQHYVDDMLSSVETEGEAIALASNVKQIHAAAGFEMRNWISNSATLLEALDEPKTEEKDLTIAEEGVTEKVLGLWWNTNTDCFTFKVSPRYDPELISGMRIPTKREVLRTLMMIFDPLGLIGHFLMFLKVILQEIWRTSVTWDDPIEEIQFEKWLQWLKVLPEVEKVEVPRCYRSTISIESAMEVQMHVFVDASENGFAAVVYLRFQQGNLTETALVGSKTRVAPLKFLSIPRSELQACVIGARFSTSILKSLTVKVDRRFFWTDSSDVISWINSDHRRYSQFVAFRISEILDTTEMHEWQWLRTQSNVADEGTKWKRVPDLRNTSRWFTGPDFLKKPINEWPVELAAPKATNEELRPHLLVHVIVPGPVIDPENFSQWTPLVRRVALVFRFISNVRISDAEQRSKGSLTTCELVRAERYLYRFAQCCAYADEIAVLTNKRVSNGNEMSVPKSSPIYQLCPFLDEHDVLRMRGRTAACPFVDQHAVNPIILPRNHQVTRLVVGHYHRMYHHQNHNTVLNELRQRYVISRLKATFNKIRRDCQQCKNDRIRPLAPIMGNLPVARLAAYSPPFSHMGVDYFGPLSVSVGRRSEKRWVLLATCLTTRAIHLQVVHSMTTNSCIMAIRNVMARRGTPAVIYSDRGTNFQGACSELETAMKNLDNERLAKEFTTSNTTWTFIPPASPHMGGAWERLVRTVKQNLDRIKPSESMPHEVLENMLNEVENIINSRPLTSIPIDNDQSPVLTPNHFLLGSSNGMRSWVPLDDSPRTLKSSWHFSQILANRFWKLWLQDYLPSITRRTKWFTETKPIKVNDIVIIVDPKLARNCWPKGRVIGIKKSTDGQVRSATVQTSSGIYERPTVKLAVLDVGVEENAHPDDQERILGGAVDSATSTLRRAPDAPVSTTPDGHQRDCFVHDRRQTP